MRRSSSRSTVRKDRNNAAWIINAIKRGGDSKVSEPRPVGRRDSCSVAKKLTLSDLDRGELDDAMPNRPGDSARSPRSECEAGRTMSLNLDRLGLWAKNA